MKASRAARIRREDAAGAETVGALILFGLFVTVIALLNVTSVPSAGLSAEEAHHEKVLDAMGGIQAEAEAASLPTAVGATVGRALPLAPERSAGGDFFSLFLAQPAQAAGQLTFEPSYGNVTLSHTRQGNPATVYDVGAAVARFPLGRLTFDPHPVFRQPGLVRLEDGAVVTTDAASETLRHAPPVTLSVQGGVTHLTVKVRVLNGTAADVGGTAGVRVGLQTEAATLTSPVNPNANAVTLRLETAHGRAWGAFLNETAADGGLTGAQSTTTVERGAGAGGLDVVTWTVAGTAGGSQNDIRLTSGLAILGVRIG
jgi:hypothetical protein